MKKFKLLPDLSPAEYSALKAHIAIWGVQVPVVKDELGNTLDGFQRERAARELNIKNYPVRTLSGLSPEQKRHYILGVNCQRRHLSTSQKQEVIAAELRQSPDISDNWLAEIIGCDHKTVTKVRRRLEARREIPELDIFRGKDGKKYRITTVPTETAAQARQAGKALRTLGKNHPGRVIRAGKATRLARYQQYEALRNGKVEDTVPKNIKLLCCDFRDLRVKGVDLIFTDPLWHDPKIWPELGRWANDTLRPGGILAAYTGVSYLPSALAGLSQYLRYHWTACLFYASEKALVSHRRMKQSWCPLVLFCKGRWTRANYINDSYRSPTKEKDCHPYQQSLPEAAYYIKALSDPGSLISDPFGGSFTTAVAVQLLGRRCFVGCDVDPGCLTVARKRLAELKN
jgi:site-specific DNA-methyltransferase (adenine-specific)